jgi:superfamily II DNA/RNA helicase
LDVLIGTPGRILDHMQRGNLDLSKLKYGLVMVLQYLKNIFIINCHYLKYFRHCILDEVDRMLDMGFQESVEEILAASYTTGSNCEELNFQLLV